MILHEIEYQRPTSLNMPILADHVTYSFLAFMKSIFRFCLGCYCGGYSQNGRSNLSSWIWCHMFVKTVRTVRLRYAFTQLVMVRSHFHCRNTVSNYWYFSETTRSFQLASHPTQAAYGGWLETNGLTQVYTTKTTQITFFRLMQNRFWN